jgi:hypothetical protein
MARVKYHKSEVHEGNYKTYIKFAEATGLPYLLTLTNYTVTITSEFLNAKFAPNMDQSAFICYQLIKRDIKETGLIKPDLISKNLQYFNFGPDSRIQYPPNEIYNIDIKSAYATVLLRHGLIKQSTFNRMARLSKRNRLACVGMLAAKKKHFSMVGRQTISATTEEKDTTEWFYFCINRIDEIMMKCRQIAGNTFLFFWVDGIFLNDIKHVKQISEYLTSIGYKYSFDICTNVQYKEDNNIKTLSYDKGEESKQLFLPKSNSELSEFMINFLSL